jgi:1-acyl-sn-glycerol-3-phosphate acyltransferase
LASAAVWSRSIVNSCAHFVPMLVVAPFSRPRAWRLYQDWVRETYRIFGVTLSVRDDNGGALGPAPHLYVWLNQSSLVEGPVSVALLPPHFTIVNVEYAAMPLLGWARVLVRDVVIVRQWKAQAKRGIERAAARMRAGESAMISIEGARSRDGGLQPFKKGPIVLALRAHATIIPMIMRGGQRIMPRGEWRIRPGQLELHLLKAIPTQGLHYEDREMLMNQLRSIAKRELDVAP